MPSAAGYLDVAISKASAQVRSLNPRVGFDFTVIIAALLPIIAACFNREEKDEDPQEFLEDHYDELTATFDRALIDRVRPQTRRAVRESHRKDRTLPRVMHRDMLDQISHQSLYQAMTAPKESFGACYAQLLADAGQAADAAATATTTDLLEAGDAE